MKPEPQGGAGKASDYHYRRALTLPELLPAFGVALGAAAAAFYVARLFLQRTPLVPMRDIPALGPARERKSRTVDDVLVRRSSRNGPRKSLPPLVPPPAITRRDARRVDAG